MNNLNGKQNGIINGNDCIEGGEWDEIEIPVPWGHISAKWWGSKDRQPVIALHGWQDNAGSFDNLAPLLIKDELSLLCIDLPGHGRSSHYSRGSYYYIFWDGIHILRRIIKHFKFEDVVLLGHSLGGAISFLYAATYPKEVKKYVSIDIPGPTVKGEKSYSMLGGTIDKYLEYDSITEEKTPSYTYDEAFE
ncbi:hydrolase, partial [Oryctes borbonicus]